MPSIGALELANVTDAVKSGWVSSLGRYVTEFEEKFAAFCGVEHAIACTNGTVAIHLVLHALGIGEGDEVIVPDLSFIATANTVLLAGAKPVFCDIEAETLGIDPAAIEALITPATKAIMPVHLYGHPADMEAVNRIARAHGLYVIEDAAEAHGAEVNGRRVGSLGDCATFSFYANKNLTTGEGGMITTNDAALAARCRHLRDHAMSATRRYWHDEMGFNYRLTNVQAAIGCAQMDRADELLGGRKEIFGWYARHMSAVPGVRLNRTAPWATNTYWLVCAEFEDVDAAGRDAIMADLKSRGVDSRPYFYPMSMMPHFIEAETPVSHAVSARGINLPTYLGLTESDVAYICEQVRAVSAACREEA
jgi:perosamine synthetase